jgi:hypothetical protein
LRKKKRAFYNKGPKYFEKNEKLKKKLKAFFIKESKIKHGKGLKI